MFPDDDSSASHVATFDELLAGLPKRADTHPTLLDMATSNGRPDEMTNAQLRDVRAHLEQHFWDFAYIIGGCDVMWAPLHQPVCELMELWGTEGWKRIMVQLPRGALKSTVFTRTGALWYATKDSNTTIAIFNEKVERVEKWLMAIKSVVMGNPLYQALWPEVLPPGVSAEDKRKGVKMPQDWKWSSKELLLRRSRTGIPEATITAMSAGGASAGGHWDRLFFDDLISEEAANSQVVMQRARDWLDTAMFLGISPESLNGWINCTRWGYGDAYDHAREMHNFRLYRRAALENGKSSFPRESNKVGLGWTTEELLRMQERRPLVFSTQMQNSPLAGENLSFEVDKLKHLQLESRDGTEGVFWVNNDPLVSVLENDEPAPSWVPMDRIAKTLLVDPAPSESGERRSEPNARNALVVRGIDAWGRRYWLDVWAGREGPIERAHRILKMMQTWGTHRLGIEEVAAQKEIIPWVRDLARRVYDDYHIHYTPLKPGRREKDMRIAGLAGSVAGGWEGSLDSCRPIIMEEMLVFPYGQTKDILDAASYDRDPGVLGRPESPDEEDEREWREQAGPQETGRDPQTGY